jgi:AraC family transcriptional regulator, transcriptional activator of pobA
MLFFKEINDIINYTHFPEQTHLSDFHIIRMDDSGMDFVKMMPPHSQDFFQIGFQQYMIETDFSLQSQHFSSLQNLLYFVAPHQTMSWVVEKQNSGFILYFKRDFLSFFKKRIEEEFPFFELNETALYELNIEQKNVIFDEFTQIRKKFKQKTPHQENILQGLLLSLLYCCKEIFEQTKLHEKEWSKSAVLARKFQNFVQKFFLEKQKVEDYANLLNVTPNYLSAIISEELNRNAKAIINERILIEAKNLLTYSSDDISTIAYQLGFKEMTHFGRFFRKETRVSPSEWRIKNKK